jgi:apolipoprotein D and lipocalin family protein
VPWRDRDGVSGVEAGVERPAEELDVPDRKERRSLPDGLRGRRGTCRGPSPRFEIARLPNRFQNRCIADVTATYSPLEAGRLRVVNECRTEDGTSIRAEGEARKAEGEGPASKLQVRFAPAWLGWLPIVWGEYQIIALAEDYRYAVIGTPDRKYLWVLSRTPRLDEHTYRRLLQDAAMQGFDTSRVKATAHSETAP